MRDHRLAAGLLLVLFAGRGHAAAPQAAPPLQRPLDPAGDVILHADGSFAEGSLPVTMLRSPDTTGPGGGGRYLVVVNSGYGVQLRARTNEGQQLLQVIDLNAAPAPVVVQDVYFPSPQSATVGAVFGTKPNGSGTWHFYVSGGFENRIWRLEFTPGAPLPLAPAHGIDDGPLTAKTIPLADMAPDSADSTYNDGRAPMYPTGLGISSNGHSSTSPTTSATRSASFTTDSPRPQLRTIGLRPPARRSQFVYPYDVRVDPWLATDVTRSM